ncbi:OmpA family protein [Flexithrix dorotheae]|uniref:OmpA family protein n=1 Tax=Flexithrix dorotheae TaxID=70993 RepID=UPI000380B9CF|nr:OmpA family protein [Flexithrix dorotheae]
MKPTFLFFFLSLLVFQLFAQEKELKKGISYFQEEEYKNALIHLNEALYADPSNVEANYFAGICHILLNSPKKGLEYLKNLEPNAETLGKPRYYYWLGMAYYKNHLFEDAKSNLYKFKSVNSNVKEDDLLTQTLASIENAIEVYKKPKGFIVDNLGETINSDSPEYNSILSKNQEKILFTRRSGNPEKKAKDMETETIYASFLDEYNLWTTPKKEELDFKVKGDNVATIQLFGNDQKMIIYQNEDLYISEYFAGEWEKPVPLGNHINTSGYESHACITEDGSTIVFSSNGYNPKGDLDLFIAFNKGNGKWGKPFPLAELNTEYDEDAPFLDKNGVLYFSSKGHSSIGGFDIFKSTHHRTAKVWSTPENLGYPINSVGDDIFFSVYNDIGFFTSNRSGGFGAEDIYKAYLFEEVVLKGRVIDLASQKPVPNATVVFIGKQKEIEAFPNESGEFQINLPFREKFTTKIFVGDQLKSEQYFQPEISDDHSRIIEQNFEIDLLHEMLNGITIKGVVYSNESRQPLEAVVKLINNQNNKEVTSTVTDSDGNFSMRVTDNQGDYSLKTSSKAHLTKDTQFFLSNARAGIIDEIILLDPTDASAPLVVKNIYFDFNSSILKELSYSSLDQMAQFLKDNPSIEIEISGHTDNVGDPAYNLILSERRAKAVVQYLRSKGIDPERMTAKGYGDQVPRVSNDDEKDGREINRRIELKITGNKDQLGN